MIERRRRGRATRPGGRVAASVVLLAAAAGLSGCAASPSAAALAPAVRVSPSPAPSPSDGKGIGGFRSPRDYVAVAEPVRVRIPSIGVDAPLERLGLDAKGAVDAPKQWQEGGWWTGGARPGQPGPAVLVGHVDSTSGPAVFYRLASLAAGARVLVQRADGTTAVFRVSGRIQVAKSQFPADLVYGPSLMPSLRLVTCGGKFDRRAGGKGHYRDNVVVTALPEQGES